MVAKSNAKNESAAEWVALSALKPWKDNPRKNDGEPVRKVTESIKRFGFGAPILARLENGEIIAGHTRWKAAKELGLDRVPVRYLDLDPADAHLLALADNRVASEAVWDDEMLAALLADMKARGEDLAATGFGDEELAMLMRDPDAGSGTPDAAPERAEELRAKWRTGSGQLWKAGSHRILCGDSRIGEDVARLMGDDRAHAMWTDPPYGVSYIGKTADVMTIENDSLTGKQLFSLLEDSFLEAQEKALVPGAAAYVAYPDGALSIQFLLACESVGWRIHQSLVWVKSSFALGYSDYHYAHEPILLAYLPGEGRRGRGGQGWYGDNAQSSVFDVAKPSASEEHPTMKPVELIVPMIQNSSPLGGAVYEPFCGSGSTVAACEATGRRCLAIELDPKYVAVTLERMSGMGLAPELVNG